MQNVRKSALVQNTHTLFGYFNSKELYSKIWLEVWLK